QLAKGERLVEVLKQGQYVPMSTAKQVVSIFAVNEGHTDDLEVAQIGVFERALHAHLDAKHSDILNKIEETGDLDDELAERLNAVAAKFALEFRAGQSSAVAGGNGAGQVQAGEQGRPAQPAA
ncbi:hypothetical protein OAO01_06020, partial [Oligoflexia bacterium]|nr:hypothetical protein [Oligoflexia bacterium]